MRVILVLLLSPPRPRAGISPPKQVEHLYYLSILRAKGQKGKRQGLTCGRLKSPGGRTANSKTVDVVAEVGVEVVAVRGAAIPRSAEPRAAALDTAL